MNYDYVHGFGVSPSILFNRCFGLMTMSGYKYIMMFEKLSMMKVKIPKAIMNLAL